MALIGDLCDADVRDELLMMVGLPPWEVLRQYAEASKDKVEVDVGQEVMRRHRGPQKSRELSQSECAELMEERPGDELGSAV